MKRRTILLFVLAVVVLIGAFLRVYNFSDWLHFELDQARDAKVVDLAIEEGAGNLPLLGPKAAGSFLRLGPIFYYFNYLSALVFGSTPAGIAAISVIFGILAIPAFYFLVRRYFEAKTSLCLMALFSVSIFLVMYSRFSWNPNALPLFVVLTLYSLLRACDREERNKGVWLIIFSFSLAVVTQLHFLAFISVPIAAAVFLAVKRPMIKIAYWAAALTLFVLMYSPMIINEIKTGGENASQFSEVIFKKSTKDSHVLAEKLIRNFTENSLGHFLILSGRMDAELPKIKKEGALKFDISCDQQCRGKLPLGLAAAAIFFSGALVLFKNVLFEKRGAKRDFAILTAVYFLATFAAFVPISYSISPRFFLVISPLPFVFLGLISEFGGKFIGKKTFVLAVILVSIFSASNLWEIKNRFGELKKAPLEPFKVSGDRILKEKNRVTLKQQYLIIDYLESFYQKNKYPIYLNSDSHYRRSFLYHLEKRGIPASDLRDSASSRKVYKNGNYFLAYSALANNDPKIESYSENYSLAGKKDFGTLVVFQLLPREEAINAVQQEFKPKGKPTSAPGVPVRCRWNEIFGECNTDGLEESEEEN
jgi:4-amino-4-deoxy-L-arabinose transferase-like glycosyltransferase